VKCCSMKIYKNRNLKSEKHEEDQIFSTPDVTCSFMYAIVLITVLSAPRGCLLSK